MLHRGFKRAGVIGAAVIMMAGLFTSTAAIADRRDFYVYNKGSEPIFYLRVSHISEDKWGPDILGEDVLEPGDRVKITFHDDEDLCYYDIQVEYKDGDTRDKRDVDLCATDSVEFYH